jgi:putative phosphoribosyl transferase
MYHHFWSGREEAALRLAAQLEKYRNTNSVIMAIPRGGVAMGFHIARRLGLPMDIVLSKKIGHPLNKEYAIGSVTFDDSFLDIHPDISKEYIDLEIQKIRKMLRDRYEMYMGAEKPIDPEGKTIIMVDDGIATGNTVMATIYMLRKKNPAKIVVAVPVLPRSQVSRISEAADELIYLEAPVFFEGVGAFFSDFEQVEDSEVIRMLREIRDTRNVGKEA